MTLNFTIQGQTFYNFYSKFNVFFFLSGFFFTGIHDSQDSRGREGYFFNSPPPLPPVSQALRHFPGDYRRELTSVHR